MKNIKQCEELLLSEQKRILAEIKSVGQKEPGNPENWEGTQGDLSDDVDGSDENSLADKFEEFEGRNAVTTELEDRLAEIKNALQKIEAGEYGKCRVCQEEIEEDRMEANPAAETCKKHLNN